MRYLVIHPLPAGLTKDEVVRLQRSSQGDPNVTGYRSFLNLSESRAVCVFDAPSRSSLADFLKKASMPYDDIIEVELEGYRGELIEARSPVGTGV